jgi:hypothetical protein
MFDFESGHPVYAVHDYFKHAGGRDIFLLDWRQVLSYDVSLLNIHIVANSVINLVNKNLPRTVLQICIVEYFSWSGMNETVRCVI